MRGVLMGLITELGREQLRFQSRLLRKLWSPLECWPLTKKSKLSPEKKVEYLKDIITQLIKRRQDLGLSSISVDDKVGCAEYLTAKYECGVRSPSSFALVCWAEALDCEWILVPRIKKDIK